MSQTGWYRILLFLLFTAFFVLNWINGRDGMADFGVYLGAADAWYSGEGPYSRSFGVASTGYYKYAPIMLMPFMAMIGLSFKLASSIFYFAIVAAAVWLIPRVVQKARDLFPVAEAPLWWMYLLLTLVVGDHLIHEVHVGNTNLLLLALAWSCYVHLIRGKKTWCGMVFGIILLAKPHFLVLLPLFLLRKEWRVLAFGGLTVILGLFLPVLGVGWNANASLLGDWYDAILTHQEMLVSSNTWTSIAANIFGIEGEVPPTWLFLITLAVAAAGMLSLLLRNGLPQTSERRWYGEYFILVALIPNLTNTDTEHFMWCIPLLAAILSQIPWRRSAMWQWALVVVIALPWLLSSPDVLGSARNHWLEQESGLMGVTNTAFVVWFVVLELRRGRALSTASGEEALEVGV